MTLNNIFNRPTVVEGVGQVYPIKIKDWEMFESYLDLLMLSKASLPIEDESVPLLNRIIAFFSEDPESVEMMTDLFNLVTRTDSFKFEVKLFPFQNYYFINDNEQEINADNYEELRKIILHQNIILEPKVFKSKRVAEWAQKALELKNRNSANVTLEDMITTVSVVKGIHYHELEDYSIYQLKSDFQRINMIKSFESSSNLFGNPYAAAEMKLTHFAETLDLYADPYKDVFKDDSNMKIKEALS